MSTKTRAILEEIQGLPPGEWRELWQQITRLAAPSQSPASVPARVSDGEFEAALDEVTGCTAGSGALQRLLDERRGDRDRDDARLKARKRKHTRG